MGIIRLPLSFLDAGLDGQCYYCLLHSESVAKLPLQLIEDDLPYLLPVVLTTTIEILVLSFAAGAAAAVTFQYAMLNYYYYYYYYYHYYYYYQHLLYEAFQSLAAFPSS